jgi:hypothetical protein
LHQACDEIDRDLDEAASVGGEAGTKFGDLRGHVEGRGVEAVSVNEPVHNPEGIKTKLVGNARSGASVDEELGMALEPEDS